MMDAITYEGDEVDDVSELRFAQSEDIQVPSAQDLASVDVRVVHKFFKQMLSEMKSMRGEISDLKLQTKTLASENVKLRTQLKTFIHVQTSEPTNCSDDQKKDDLISQIPPVTSEDAKSIKNFIITQSDTYEELLEEMKELEDSSEETKMKHVSTCAFHSR